MLNICNTAHLNFELKKEIGHEGINSKVFLAHDKQLDAQIVIKRIDKTAFQDKDTFFKECKILYYSSHDNVVQVKYGCEDDNYIYLAMPYYSVGSINQLIQSRYLTVREIIRYSLQFLSGLHNIHSKGLIHFDIKPDNILISDSNEALISDFGLAKYTDAYGIARQERFYQYQTPPERFFTDSFTTAFDIYQAGITIYRMCNGNEMFYEQSKDMKDFQGNFDWNTFKRKITKGQFPDRNKYKPHISKKLIKIINKAIHVDPDKRYQNVLDFTNELSKIDEFLDWQLIIGDNKKIYQKKQIIKYLKYPLLNQIVILNARQPN